MMYQKTTLDNGLRILTSTMPHTRSVTIGFFIGVGSRYEADEEGGISHFIEHMFFKGTAKRPTAREIAVAIEGVGGVFNGSTAQELSTYWAKVAQQHLPLAVDVIADMLLHSRFDPLEVEKERRVIIEEINQILDTPDDLVYLLLNRSLWPGHPLGRDVAGTKESVAALDREMMLSYLQRHYGPENTVIAVAGNMEHGAVVEQIAAQLGDWAGSGASHFLPVMDEQDEPRLRLQYKETEQAHLCLGLRGIPRTHPDRFILRLLNAILGEGTSSRLFLEIRERQGLAYEVHSYLNYLHDTGMVGIYAGVDPGRIGQAIEAILAEWDKLRGERVTEEELAKAKEFVKGRLLLQMEDSAAVASWLGGQELLEGNILTVEEVLELIDAVTAEEVQRVAQDLLVGERLNLAVVGPFANETPLRKAMRGKTP